MAFCVAVTLCSTASAVPSGDADLNEVVDLRDLLAIRNQIGQSGPPGTVPADVNNNGIVDAADYTVWRVNFPSVGNPSGPYLDIFDPRDETLSGNRRPVILIDYSPTGLPIDVDSLEIIVDGVDRTDEAIVNTRHAVLPIDQPLANGPHFVAASIADILGNESMQRSDFELTPLTLLPRANVYSGPAPFTPTFYPDVIWADIPPACYQWDFDGNGTFEIQCGFTDGARPDNRSFTYFEEGVYNVKFRVTLSDATFAEATLKVAATESFASASPVSGTAPLTVFLHGIAADLSDPITLYEWDFDYAGAFSADFSSTTNPNTVHVYTVPGAYDPVFRATHMSGAVVEHPIKRDEVRVTSPTGPTAFATAAQGVGALTVNFTGSGLDDGQIVLYEWDFENDGVYDFSDPDDGNTSHTYPTAGEKIAAFRVTDDDANQAVARVRVETIAPADLEIIDDTVVPANDEEVVIRTTTTIESNVWLYIRDASGEVIKTIIDHEVRPAGQYDDMWDGRDFRYEPLHPGPYYAVMQYSYPGRTDTLDLTNITGGNHYFAPKPPPVVTSFDPLADNPLPMRFEIPSASRASLYVLPGGSNRTDTLFDNLALGGGTYEYFWAGVDSEGQFAPANTYLWTVNAWTLPDNAIVVKGQPEIADIEITPNQLSPTDRPLGSAMSMVDFNLNEAASVFVNVVSMTTNKTLRSYSLADIPIGPNGFDWDGKTADGRYVSPGFYRLSMYAVDDNGNLSSEREGIVEIRY